MNHFRFDPLGLEEASKTNFIVPVYSLMDGMNPLLFVFQGLVDLLGEMSRHYSNTQIGFKVSQFVGICNGIKSNLVRNLTSLDNQKHIDYENKIYQLRELSRKIYFFFNQFFDTFKKGLMFVFEKPFKDGSEPGELRHKMISFVYINEEYNIHEVDYLIGKSALFREIPKYKPDGNISDMND